MLERECRDAVARSLLEDVGSGDVSAALIDAKTMVTARLITREDMLLCGQAWFDEVYRQVDPRVTVYWLVPEAGRAVAGQALAMVHGPARAVLTGERAALNWLQTLSGTATVVSAYVDCLSGFATRLLDTRKTLPGLRLAQKYAVRCGGGKNHRMGLYDAFLIKENHIAAAGGITPAINAARALHAHLPLEIEVENLDQLREALSAKPDQIMLDNFNVEHMREAVKITAGKVPLEVSGNVSLANLRAIAATGVDFISVGALTKHLRAIDLSLRIT